MALSPQNIVIVGAGPAGLLLAHYLRQRHYRVAIYDNRPDPRRAHPDQHRSFPISLQWRGRKALAGIPDLEAEIAQHSIFCRGTCVHRQGTSRAIPRQNAVMTVDRNRLVLALLEHLHHRDHSSEHLSITFDCTCVGVDREQRTVRFQSQTGEHLVVPYDRLIGADGARSQVRATLEQHDGLQCEQCYVLDAYKSIFLDRRNEAQGVELAPDLIHATNLNQHVRMILAPQPDDRLHGAFIFHPDYNPFDGLTTATDVLNYFAKHLPTFRPLLSETEAAALLHRPVARLLSVKCDRFHGGDRILILGDAAHAVSPSIGQGCNAALEDVWWINQLLDQYHDDWAQVLPQFSHQRVAAAHALRELSDYTFPRSPFLVMEFFLRLTLTRTLHQWFPQWFHPFVFDLILDTDLSYTEVLRRSSGWINKVKRSMPTINHSEQID